MFQTEACKIGEKLGGRFPGMGVEGRKLIGYCRVSTQRQFTEGHALERYIEQLRKYGVDNENIFWDVESGATSKRAGYQIVMEKLRSKEFNVLVVPCFDRFTRNVLDWEKAAEELQNLGAEVVLLDKGKIDIETPYGEFTNTVMAAAASLTQKMNKYNAIQGMKYRRAHGKSCAVPFGYRLDPEGRLILDDTSFLSYSVTRAEVAREVLEVYMENTSLIKTIQVLVEKYNILAYGKPKKGECFPLTAVGLRYWINIPVLRGALIYFWRDKDKRHEAEYTPPALLSTEEWTRVEYLLSVGAKLRRSFSHNRPILNPLAGRMFCGECGSKLRCCSTFNKNTKYRYTYLYCETKHNYKVGLPYCSQRGNYGYHLDDYIKKTVECIQEHAEEVALAWKNRTDSPLDSMNEVLLDSPEYCELLNRIQKLESLNDPDLIDVIELKRKQLTLLKSKLYAELEEYEYDISRLQDIISTPGFWDTTDIASLKIIFDELVSRVTQRDGVITVTLKF